MRVRGIPALFTILPLSPPRAVWFAKNVAWGTYPWPLIPSEVPLVDTAVTSLDGVAASIRATRGIGPKATRRTKLRERGFSHSDSLRCYRFLTGCGRRVPPTHDLVKMVGNRVSEET